MSWLREANSLPIEYGSKEGCGGDVIVLTTYMDINFTYRGPVQTARPPAGSPPPATGRAEMDVVKSPQYQFEELQKQIKVLQGQISEFEFTKREVVSNKHDSALGLKFLNESIVSLYETLKKDKASFESKIAVVQEEVNSFAAILARVEKLEAIVASLAQPPPVATVEQAPAKGPAVRPGTAYRPWGRATGKATEQPTSAQAHLSALLQKMHELRI